MVEAYQFGAATLTGDAEPALVSAPRVSPGLLRVLGVVPRLGRLFYEGDTVSGESVALISEGFWTRRFGRAEDVIGRRLSVDDEPHVIVGVLPARFAFPEQRVEVWRPLVLDSVQGPPGRVLAVVMLRGQTRREVVSEQLTAISRRLQNDAVLPRDSGLVFEDLLQLRYGRQYSTALYVMLGAIALVLLVACVNVTNLLLARATARRGEFAVMTALGASRPQLFAEALVESLGPCRAVWCRRLADCSPAACDDPGSASTADDDALGCRHPGLACVGICRVRVDDHVSGCRNTSGRADCGGQSHRGPQGAVARRYWRSMTGAARGGSPLWWWRSWPSC